MFVVHKDLAEARAAADLAHLAETLVVVAGDAHALGADAPPGGCSVCSMRVVRRRDVGTVSTRHGVLQWSAYEVPWPAPAPRPPCTYSPLPARPAPLRQAPTGRRWGLPLR